VHHQWGDLVQRHPALPARRQRVALLVGLEAGRPEAPEEPHHGQVELPVAAVGGRIHEPAPPLVVDEAVAGPQVTVEAGRRLVGRPEEFEPPGQRLQPGDRLSRQHVGVAGQLGQRYEAALPVELRPRGRRLVGQAPAARGAPILPPEGWRSGLVQASEGGTEIGIGRSVGAALVDPLQHEVGRVVVGHGHHRR
jgi:hypothetical protein